MRLSFIPIAICIALLFCSQAAFAEEQNLTDTDRQLLIDQTVDQFYLALDAIVALEILGIFFGLNKQMKKVFGRRRS